MTIVPIDNHPRTPRKLQFIGIGVSKLTLKSINIIQSSNNYSIVSSFIYRNQNIVHMKILYTSVKMTKSRLRFRGLKMCITRVKLNMSINYFKNVNFQFQTIIAKQSNLSSSSR